MFWLHAFEEECVLHILFGLLLQCSHCLCTNDVSDVNFLMHHLGMCGLSWSSKDLCHDIFIWVASNNLSQTWINVFIHNLYIVTLIFKNFLGLWIHLNGTFCLFSNFEGMLATRCKSYSGKWVIFGWNLTSRRKSFIVLDYIKPP